MFKIRDMELDDVIRVSEIEHASHLLPWSEDIFYNCLLVGYDCRVLELTKDKQVVAYMISRNTDKQQCHILNLCVAADYQRHGFAAALLKYLIASIKKNTLKSIILEVRPSNQPALTLYEKFNFNLVGVKPAYYVDSAGHSEDALIFERAMA